MSLIRREHAPTGGRYEHGIEHTSNTWQNCTRRYGAGGYRAHALNGSIERDRKFLDKITDIGVSVNNDVFWPRKQIRARDRTGGRDFALELSFGIAELTRPAVNAVPALRIALERNAYTAKLLDSLRTARAIDSIYARSIVDSLRADSMRTGRLPLSRAVPVEKAFDFTLNERRQTVGRVPPDTQVTLISAAKEKPRSAPLDTTWAFEFAIGYGQISGFGFREKKVPGLDLQGSLRELPAIAFYGTARHWGIAGASPYFGIRSGLATLDNVRAYTAADTVYQVKGSTFQAGGAVGLVWGITDRVHAFAETNYTWRDFPGVDWGATGKALGKEFPRRLNFSTAGISVGIQVHVANPASKA